MASAYSPEGTAVAAIFFLVTAWVSSALRLYVRVRYGKGPFLDDLLAVVATVRLDHIRSSLSELDKQSRSNPDEQLVFTIYTVIFVYYQINDLIPLAIQPTPLAGQRLRPLPFSSSRELTHRLLFVCDLLYTFGTYIMKLSFTCMLLRLAQTRRQFVVLAVTIISGAILTVTSFIHDILFCHPTSYQWTRFGDPTAEGHCDPFWSRALITLFHGSWVMLADIILGLVVPLMLLWDVCMHPRTKCSIRFLLGLGSLASIATIIRLAYLGLATGPTVTWAVIPMAFWSIVEQGVSITCIAAATLKPLFVRIGVVDPRDQSPVQLPARDAHDPDSENGVVMEDSLNRGHSGVSEGSTVAADWGKVQVHLSPPKKTWREKANGRADSGVGVRTEVQVSKPSSLD
ncbi:hypothetical protein BJX63DRAFT_121884 [Aspergillus granulosus]|uniref:Rhodopsin domain-containing protein n=1 Tax=Aspergillus granulosus TaxID=176169 RepID=A0ABR4I405_9EURO